MAIIQCCNIMCRYNTGEVPKRILRDDEPLHFGECIYVGMIILENSMESKCECEGLSCNNFQWKACVKESDKND